MGVGSDEGWRVDDGMESGAESRVQSGGNLSGMCGGEWSGEWSGERYSNEWKGCNGGGGERVAWRDGVWTK